MLYIILFLGSLAFIWYGFRYRESDSFLTYRSTKVGFSDTGHRLLYQCATHYCEKSLPGTTFVTKNHETILNTKSIISRTIWYQTRPYSLHICPIWAHLNVKLRFLKELASPPTWKCVGIHWCNHKRIVTSYKFDLNCVILTGYSAKVIKMASVLQTSLYS